MKEKKECELNRLNVIIVKIFLSLYKVGGL